MAANDPSQPSAAAGGCLIKWNEDFPPPTATAIPGTLQLKLVPITNFVFFKPANCSVVDETGASVQFATLTATALSFPMSAGNTYTLSVAYFPAPKAHPASAKLQEDCPNASGGLTIDQTTPTGKYTFEVK